MPKWVKLLTAILLLPVCAGTARALWEVLRQTGGADHIWIPMLAGAATWIVVFLLLPKPMWVYVFGHELTHAVWTWMFGGSITQFKASSKGGHVVATKSNFLIVLAPYFFPLYAVMLGVVFLVCRLLNIWHTSWFPWFHVLLGAAYAFHLTLTWHILQNRQSDITSQGWLFSGVVIFLGNAVVLLLAAPLLMQHGLLRVPGLWLQCNGDVLRLIGRWL